MARKPLGTIVRQLGNRRFRATGASCALIWIATLAIGCDSEIQKEFRSAAVSSIETGVNAIFDGVISGVFAVADTEASKSTSSTGTSTADTSSSDTAAGES